MTKFSEVAHLYLGCEIMIYFEDENGKFTDEFTGQLAWDREEDGPFYYVDNKQDNGKKYDHADYEETDFRIKPVLRRLSSLSKEECKECELQDVQIGLIMYGSHQQVYLTTKQFTLLLSKHFDLHELIDNNEAIESPSLSIGGEEK